jgi:hypothetical protein
MSIVGISITKETTFRDSLQEFSNVYYYNGGLTEMPNNAGQNNMVDEIVTAEKTWHASDVNFKFARMWLQTLTEAGTIMLIQKLLTGVGVLSPDVNIDRERAFLFRWRAGSDDRGNPVYLRKWYHSCAAFPGSGGLHTGLYSNKQGFTDAQRTAMAANVAVISSIGADPEEWHLCAKSGRDADGDTPNAHKYLEHRQLGDQWRG